MKLKNLLLVPLVAGLFASSHVFAFSSGTEESEARNCLQSSGSGSSFTYAYKNPGWNGKACKRPLHVFACKGSTCKTTQKGSDTTGVINQNGQWRPGFTPKSSAVIFND